MSRRQSWRAVAIVLGDRMANHATCPQRAESHLTLGAPAHPRIEDGLAVDCPFCKDRDAFRQFTTRLAQVADDDH